MADLDLSFATQDLFREIKCPKGMAIFDQGNPSVSAYVVRSGRVEIRKKKSDGSGYIVLGHIAPGGMFGEMALVDNKPRMATAVAVADTTCLLIPADEFRQKLSEAPSGIQGVMRVLTATIRHVSGFIQEDIAAPDEDGPVIDMKM